MMKEIYPYVNHIYFPTELYRLTCHVSTMSCICSQIAIILYIFSVISENIALHIISIGFLSLYGVVNVLIFYVKLINNVTVLFTQTRLRYKAKTFYNMQHIYNIMHTAMIIDTNV